MNWNTRTVAFVGLMTLSILVFGCQATKIQEDINYGQTPKVYFDENKNGDSTIAVLQWEEFFQDPALKDLIAVALTNNQENLKTLERIKLAGAEFKMARVGMLPEINGFAGAYRQRFGEYTMDGVGNADSNLSPSVPEDKKIPDPYRDFIIGAQFNWELDIWGKYKNRKKAAAARYLASQEMANLVKTLLISEVAQSYYILVGLDEELRVLEENIRLQELAVNLTKDLKTAGKENQLAVDQFEALMLNSKALLVEKQRQLRSEELRLTGLLGVYQFDHQRLGLDRVFDRPELVQIGLPSDLLLLRPDIRSAEQELLASKADISVARAAYFPSFNLFGMAGFNAFDFSRLFLNPASSVYQFGAGLVAPVFNRNQIRANFEAANSRQRIAWYDYEQTVLRSYLEVLDLVNEFRTYDEQLQVKTYEVEVQKRSVENSNTMFMVGYANYLEVINAQSRALQSQIELIELKVKQLQSNVKLYRALGGGWI